MWRWTIYNIFWFKTKLVTNYYVSQKNILVSLFISCLFLKQISKFDEYLNILILCNYKEIKDANCP